MKTKKKKSTRKIPFRNYVLTLLMFIGVVLVSLYIYKWYEIKKYERLSRSYLVEKNVITNKINTLEELDAVLKEAPSNLILYITYRNDLDVYNVERKITKTLKKYNIQDMIYLFDITDLMNNDNHFIDKLNKKLDINVTKFPVYIYYEDSVISSYKNIENKKDLINLFEKYNIEKNSL